jgi:hypothetical protein
MAEGDAVMILSLLQQTVRELSSPEATRAAEWVDSIIAFFDSPLPFSPLAEYMLVILVLWLLAKRKEPKPNFDEQAQQVLDHKYHQGELTKDAYDKLRQDMSLRPK